MCHFQDKVDLYSLCKNPVYKHSSMLYLTSKPPPNLWHVAYMPYDEEC